MDKDIKEAMESLCKHPDWAKRQEVVKIAIELGWKVWGKLKKYDGSSYQCFRRKNDYAWIGLRYVEVTTSPFAVDFITNFKDVKTFLN